jgi:hypothetical protein
MTKQLPPKPSLENLAKQAKGILKAHQNKDEAVCPRLKALNRFAKASDKEILDGELNLADAQFVLAMEYGFKSWNEMKMHVESPAQERVFSHPDDLLRLGNRAIEVLLRDIDSRDLTVFMMNIHPDLFARIWKNLAQRRRELLKNDMAEIGEVTRENMAIVQERVLSIANKIADELTAGGLEEGETTMSEWKDSMIKELAKKAAGDRTSAELVPVFVGLVKWARREGLVAMDGFAEQHISDELMQLGLRMTIDGTDVAEIQSILKAKKTTMVQAYERRLEMIIAGVEGIGTGLNPALMEEKCRAFLG